ncbi:MAG: hypothetical protein JKY60_12275 [Kordiimonadaceae bacterium]|nr:hypothetical protein [Kordiimonadaceae bacterium]
MEKKKLATSLKTRFWAHMRIALAPADEQILHSVRANHLHSEKEKQNANDLSKTKRHPSIA